MREAELAAEKLVHILNPKHSLLVETEGLPSSDFGPRNTVLTAAFKERQARNVFKSRLPLRACSA